MKHVPNTAAIDLTLARYLKSEQAQVTAYGEIEWTEVNGVWRGTTPCAVGATRATLTHELYLQYQHRPSAVTEPTVVYLLGKVQLWRIDHNQIHKLKRSTHIQTDLDRAYFEEIDSRISPIMGPTIAGNDVMRVFHQSATMLKIDTTSVTWNDPPGGAS